MAARKQLWHPDAVRFYVYAVVAESGLPIYVGKGSGHRAARSAKKHGGRAVILERFSSEKAAYAAEKRHIAELSPHANVCAGGNGARAVKRRVRVSAEDREMRRVGTRVFAARFLCSKLDETNIAQFGVSKVELDRCRQVARG